MNAIRHRSRRRHVHPLKPARNRRARPLWAFALPALLALAILVVLFADQFRNFGLSGMGDSPMGSGGTGDSGGSLSYNRSDTEASYASVVEQTGIHAGAGGFDINVGNNTNLTGAVIASEAEAALNRLSTQTLTFSQIRPLALGYATMNHAE